MAETAQSLLELGARNVILKLGARGCYVAGQDCASTHIPGFTVAAVDTKAGGDCFNAAFASQIVRGESPLQAARYANAAAALCVSSPGAQSAVPLAAEVDEFLRRSERTREVALTTPYSDGSLEHTGGSP